MSLLNKNTLIPLLPRAPAAWSPDLLNTFLQNHIPVLAFPEILNVPVTSNSQDASESSNRVLAVSFCFISDLLDQKNQPFMISLITEDQSEMVTLTQTKTSGHYTSSTTNPSTLIERILHTHSIQTNPYNTRSLNSLIFTFSLPDICEFLHLSPESTCMSCLNTVHHAVGKARYQTSCKKKQALIDNVQDPPAEFFNWLLPQLDTSWIPLPRKRNNVSITCPLCQETYVVPKLDPSASTLTCPHCGKEFALKRQSPHNKNQIVRGWFIQHSKDRRYLIFRQYKVEFYEYHEFFTIDECQRIYMNLHPSGKRIFTGMHNRYGSWILRPSSQTFPKPAVFHAWQSPPLYLPVQLPMNIKGNLWTGNFASEFAGTQWQYFPESPHMVVNESFITMFHQFKADSPFEHLIKQGFPDLAVKLHAALQHPEQNQPLSLHLHEKRADRILNIPAAAFREHKMEIQSSLQNDNWIPILQYWQCFAEKKGAVEVLSHLLSMKDFSLLNLMLRIPQFHSTSSFQRLLKILNQDQQKTNYYSSYRQHGYYSDYLEMCTAMNVDLSIPDNLYPSLLKQAHDRLAHLYNFSKSNLNNKRLHQIHEACQPLEYESGPYQLTIPDSTRDFFQEGMNLHHCVASYGERHQNGHTLIGFIRRKEKPNQSLYTLELHNWSIVQVQGDHHCQPPQAVLDFANEWIQQKVRPIANQYTSNNGQKQFMTRTLPTLCA